MLGRKWKQGRGWGLGSSFNLGSQGTSRRREGREMGGERGGGLGGGVASWVEDQEGVRSVPCSREGSELKLYFGDLLG